MKKYLEFFAKKNFELKHKLEKVKFWYHYSLDFIIQKEILKFLKDLKYYITEIDISKDITAAGEVYNIYMHWWHIMRSILPDISLRKETEELLKLENLVKIDGILNKKSQSSYISSTQDLTPQQKTQAEDILNDYLLKKDRSNLHEIWIKTPIKNITPTVGSFQALVANISLTKSKFKVHTWEGDIKIGISGLEILELEPKLIYCEYITKESTQKKSKNE